MSIHLAKSARTLVVLAFVCLTAMNRESTEASYEDNAIDNVRSGTRLSCTLETYADGSLAFGADVDVIIGSRREVRIEAVARPPFAGEIFSVRDGHTGGDYVVGADRLKSHSLDAPVFVFKSREEQALFYLAETVNRNLSVAFDPSDITRLALAGALVRFGQARQSGVSQYEISHSRLSELHSGFTRVWLTDSGFLVRQEFYSTSQSYTPDSVFDCWSVRRVAVAPTAFEILPPNDVTIEHLSSKEIGSSQLEGELSARGAPDIIATLLRPTNRLVRAILIQSEMSKKGISLSERWGIVASWLNPSGEPTLVILGDSESSFPVDLPFWSTAVAKKGTLLADGNHFAHGTVGSSSRKLQMGLAIAGHTLADSNHFYRFDRDGVSAIILKSPSDDLGGMLNSDVLATLKGSRVLGTDGRVQETGSND